MRRKAKAFFPYTYLQPPESLFTVYAAYLLCGPSVVLEWRGRVQLGASYGLKKDIWKRLSCPLEDVVVLIP